MSDDEKTEAVVKSEPKPPMMIGKNGLEMNTMDDAWRFAHYVVKSGLAPKSLQKPEAIVVALQMGFEVGLSPMNALQNTAVINGRPCLWGDAVLGLVRASGLLEKYSETYIGEKGTDGYACEVRSTRKDMGEMVSTFSVGDAKTAGLWEKPGPWSQYPDRMLKFRSRGFNLRDNFGDVLKGLRVAEEERDITIDVEVSEPMQSTSLDSPDAAKLEDAVTVEKVKTKTPAKGKGKAKKESEPKVTEETLKEDPPKEVNEPESKDGETKPNMFAAGGLGSPDE